MPRNTSISWQLRMYIEFSVYNMCIKCFRFVFRKHSSTYHFISSSEELVYFYNLLELAAHVDKLVITVLNTKHFRYQSKRIRNLGITIDKIFFSTLRKPFLLCALRNTPLKSFQLDMKYRTCAEKAGVLIQPEFSFTEGCSFSVFYRWIYILGFNHL